MSGQGIVEKIQIYPGISVDKDLFIIPQRNAFEFYLLRGAKPKRLHRKRFAPQSVSNFFPNLGDASAVPTVTYERRSSDGGAGAGTYNDCQPRCPTSSDSAVTSLVNSIQLNSGVPRLVEENRERPQILDYKGLSPFLERLLWV